MRLIRRTLNPMAFLRSSISLACALWCQAAWPVACAVDWNQAGAPVNRGILSVHGVMQPYIEPDPNVMRTFKLTNPTGTHSRLETWISRMEPWNDNSNPAVFNWSVFAPMRMLRFLENRAAFDQLVDQMGMTRLLLLCYNAPWLYSGNDADPVGNKQEWAEFAAACVQAYNGAGYNPNPPVPFVEIWNEPDLSFFYSGTRQSYFDLFRIAADRIHNNYPGVLVGGPAVSPDGLSSGFLSEFLSNAGTYADVLTYHSYGHSVSKMVTDVQYWSQQFRSLPGKSNGLISITETDYTTTGWTKARYMIDRHFRLFAIQNLLHSVHHFCALDYNESGNYSFGLFDRYGVPFDGTFWPYWIFRGLIGNFSPATLSGSDASFFDALASRHWNAGGALLNSMVLRSKKSSTSQAVLSLSYPASGKPRTMIVERLGQSFKGVSAVVPIQPSQTFTQLSLSLSGYECIAVHLVEGGARHLGYIDLFNQEAPWLTVSTSETSLRIGASMTVTVQATNTTTQRFEGYVGLKGFPSGWTVGMPAAKSVVRLNPGETATRTMVLTAATSTSATDFGLYATLESDGLRRGSRTERTRSLPKKIGILP